MVKKHKVISPLFFNRPVLTVAPQLLGKFLVRKIGSTTIALMITEVEAYDGPHDLACHASKGRTKRTETLFAPAGTWYVYLIYGLYDMLNIVTGPKDYPAAILIRGVEGVAGPGRLTRRFKIDRSLNSKLTNKKSGLWIEDRGVIIKKSHIKTSPRIGVDYAGPIWSKKHYRFYL